MAQVILSSIGAALGGPVGGYVGALLGAAVDGAAINALSPARQVGPAHSRAADHRRGRGGGDPVRVRARPGGRPRDLGGAVSRAADRGPGRRKQGGQDDVLRLQPVVRRGLKRRPHRRDRPGVGRRQGDGSDRRDDAPAPGTEDQTPDPLIEAIEGQAPAYRGLAYVVFEDLPLEAFGNRPPQLSFEVFRRPRAGVAGLEDRLKGVCLIPGAGEFVYATDAVLRREGLTRTTAENVNNAEGRPDLTVSLDQLQAQLPRVDHVTLVVSWFGTDLRAGACLVKPGVDQAAKATLPFDWRAGGVDRAGAHVVSSHDGFPAYGGTPSDRAVLQAIAELKRRGLKVTLYPFVLMDVPEGSGLPDPYGASGQGAYPWRGRITCHPAPGRPGSPDGTATAAGQVSGFFGNATPGQIGTRDGLPSFTGGADWGFRRMILHYARLAQLAGGVDGFLIGSELRGLTTVRGAGGAYPAVSALKALAGDVRGMVGGGDKDRLRRRLERIFRPSAGRRRGPFGVPPRPAVGRSGHRLRRRRLLSAGHRLADGEAHLDAAAGFSGPHDPAYLRAGLTGGEGFDWFYASDAARAAQVRTPITDGAHGEAWMFRPKDLASWWSNVHHDRPGGLRSASPTAWVPKSKPIRLTEFGCPAVDKGANAPNLFIDPKSSESVPPPFSSGARDEFGQRLFLEAVLDWIGDPAANPVSPTYGGPMIEAASAWCWDARPFPDFPARANVWSDGPNWPLGHWLNGRAGIAPLAALISALAARAEVAVDPGEASGAVAGYVVDRPMRLRDALAPLTAAFGLDAVERGGGTRIVARSGLATAVLTDADLAWPEDRAAALSASRTLNAPARALRLRFIDAARDYQTGALIVRREDGRGTADADAPIVMAAAEAEVAATRMLAGEAAARRETVVHLSPLAALLLEAGERVAFAGETWRVVRVDLDERPRATLAPIVGASELGGLIDWTPAPPRETVGPPVVHVLDLPAAPGAEDDARPWAAVAAEPWRPFDLHVGGDLDTLKVRARLAAPATLGVTMADLPPASPHRLDRVGRLTVRLEGATPVSRSLAAVLGGDNALAVLGPSGEWEILGFTTVEAVAEDVWTLSGLLRGQRDGAASEATVPAGAPAVLLDEAVVRLDVAPFERGASLLVRAAPAGGPPAGPAMSQTAMTWRGRAARPLAPAHLRVRVSGGDRLIGWIRRDRVGGDVWDGETPLGEAREVYRLRVLNGGAVVREVELETPAFVHTAASRAADLAAGAGPLSVEVAQGSAGLGWGAAATLSL